MADLFSHEFILRFIGSAIMEWSRALMYALGFILLVLAGLVFGKRMGWFLKGPVTGGGEFDDDDEYQENYGSRYDMNPDDMYDEGEFVDGGGMFRLRVSDPEYTALLEGKKTVEVRPDRQPFTRLKEGDTVVVVRARPKEDTSEYPGGKYKHESKVVRITKYASLEELLKKEPLAKVYPGKSAAEATERFNMYLRPGATAKDPVMAIELKVSSEKSAKKSK